jgi:rhodanese-related sulfurtransferase
MMMLIASFFARVVVPAVLILMVSLIPAVVAGFLHPKRPPFAADGLRDGEMRVEEAWLMRSEVLWVDARRQEEYEAGHIDGAVLLNEDRWYDLLPNVLAKWHPERRTVVYCSSSGCQASHHVAKRLRDSGLTNVWVLKGGWEAWQDFKRRHEQ